VTMSARAKAGPWPDRVQQRAPSPDAAAYQPTRVSRLPADPPERAASGSRSELGVAERLGPEPDPPAFRANRVGTASLSDVGWRESRSPSRR
jgi:hypothetical protein